MRLLTWAVAVALLLPALAAAGTEAGLPQRLDAPPPADLAQAFDDAWAVLLAGDYQQGLPLIEAVLRKSQDRLGSTAPFTLKAQDHYGGTLMRLGRLADARREFEAILARHQEAGTEDTRAFLSSLNNLAKTVEGAESSQAALPLYQRAMALRSRLLGDEDLESVTVLDDYAGALGEIGQVHEGVSVIERALRIREQGLGSTHRWTLTTKGNLAHMLTQLGRYREALALNEQVLQQRLADLGETHPSTLVTMSNTAVQLERLGRFEEARVLQERAVALKTQQFGARHSSTLSSRRGLASARRALGRTDEAIVELQGVLQDSLLDHPPSHQQPQLTRVALALALEQSQRLDQALAVMSTAHQLYLETLGPDHFRTLDAATHHARLLRRLGHSALALKVLGDAVERLRRTQGEAAPLALQAAYEGAACMEAMGQHTEAEAILAPMTAHIDRAYAAIQEDSDPRRAITRLADDAHRLRAHALARLGRTPEAFSLIEQGKARRLVAQLTERALTLSAGVSQAEWHGLQKARERVFAAQGALRELKATPDRPKRLLALEQANADVDAIRARWQQTYPRYAAQRQLPNVQAHDGHLLPPTGLYVSYTLLDADQTLAATTLDAQGRLQWHRLGHQPGLAEQVAAFRLWTLQQGRRSFFDDQNRPVEIVRWEQQGQTQWRVLPRDAADCTPEHHAGCRPVQAQAVWQTADYEELRRKLSQLLLRPMRERASGHFNRWIISPDGTLGELPFDVLDWQGKAVVTRVAVSQLPSLSVLRALHAIPDRPKRRAVDELALFAMGNPSFSGMAAAGDAPPALPPDGLDQASQPTRGNIPPPDATPVWPALPFSEWEMRLAAAQFANRPTVVLSGPAATPTRLRQASDSGELARARRVLLATHAQVDPDSPQNTLLALSPDPGPQASNGHLGLADILGLKLDSELTVLSACNTARSDGGRDTDGRFGFAYALQLAGNRNAVLTLWAVRDRSTATFTARFFHHLSQGMDDALALQATKREFMRHPNPRWGEARNWAGFVMFGRQHTN